MNNMSWSVEIEVSVEGTTLGNNSQYIQAHLNEWLAKAKQPKCPISKWDGSFGNCLELVSPVFRSRRGYLWLQAVCAFLVQAGAKPHNKTGIHVHVGTWDIPYKMVPRAWAEQILKAWEQNKRSYRIQEPHPDRLQYCHPPALPAGRAVTFDAFETSRYKEVNWQALEKFKTVEFRAYNGTLDPKLMRTYVQCSLATMAQVTSLTPPVSVDKTKASQTTTRSKIRAKARQHKLAKLAQAASRPAARRPANDCECPACCRLRNEASLLGQIPNNNNDIPF